MVRTHESLIARAPAGVCASLSLAVAVTLAASTGWAQTEGDEAPEAPPADSIGGEEVESAPIRLTFQGRLSAVNVVLSGALDGSANQVPLATPGLRLLEGRLFAGLGFGFFGVEGANTGLSFSPLVTVDVVRDVDLGAFYVAGWFTLGSFDGPRAVGGGDNDLFAWGFSAMAGVRAILTRALALGVEMGWGFLSLNQDGSGFVHGMSGNLLLEASLGL